MKHRFISLFLMLAVIALPVGLAIVMTGEVILAFVFFYPLLMSGLWMVGGLTFYLRHERRWPWGESMAERAVPELPGNPLVTILIPCFNEARHGEAAVLAALRQRYDNIEVIAINDGSSDGTAPMLERMAAQHARLRIIHLAHNQGKAMALRMGALAANSEYLVCIDGDAILDPDAVAFLVRPLLDNPRLGAITGNPRVRTRSTLTGAVQVGEFSSIIGLIKRTQRVYGQIFTVSGAIAAFRKRALARVGYWSLDMVTEDIDISWKLQRDHWSVFYEPRALCWILMPETLKGLWKQRLRWAQGGAEILIKNLDSLMRWRNRRMWLLLLEFTLSALWSFSFALSIVLYLLGLFMELPPQLRVDSLVPPAFTGLVLAVFCLLQFFISVLIESRYEKGFARNLLWIIWYPLVFWMLNLFTTLVSFPQIMLGKRRQRARWISPDRGIKHLDGTP
ncbi:poly-beta-1,6-N-acetyl-D-glucosamine synthase [Comamonas sp.]